MRLIQYSYPSARFSGALGGSRSPWTGLESEIDRMFSSVVDGYASVTRAGRNFPVDFFEDKNAYYVRAELPGVTRDDIGVEVVENALTVTAVRRSKSGERENSFSFSRSVSIPDQVQSDKVGAAYENGILTVTLPKREEAKPRKVTVSVS
jgi:HSP20 family protein